MGSNVSDDAYSSFSAACSDINEPSELQRTSTTNSVEPLETDETANETTPNCNNTSEDEYQGFPWDQYPAFAKADHNKRERVSWVWREGYRVQEIKTGNVYWFCRECMRQKVARPMRYLHTGGTANPTRHLKNVHYISKEGPVHKKRHIEDAFQRQGESAMQAFINRGVERLNPPRCRTALIRWVAYSNIAFRQIEGEPFRRFLNECNVRLESAGCLPSSSTVRAWILKDFEQYSAVVKQLLQSFNRRVHFTFDLWTAGNLLCLNGIFVHWLDNDGRKRKVLLSLPSIDENHTGENIAKGVEKIILEFDLQQRIGYFVLDNASNCSSAVEVLAEKFSFDATKRRLRCAVHIINLIAQQIMYGSDLSAFEEEGYNAMDLRKELEQWRQRGVLGRLRNIIYWITDKHADGSRYRTFEKYQKEAAQCTNSSEKPAGLRRPNDTRWNSHYYAFESACANRAAIDDYCDQETHNHNRTVRQICERNSHRRRQQKKPQPNVLVTDALTSDDWVSVTQYMAILKPLMLCTKKLEGSPTEGQDGCIWEVLPVYEFLLNHLEKLTVQYSVDEDNGLQHLRIATQLGWQKTNEYYQKLDDMPVYIAAFLLHPKYRLRKLKSLWKDKEDWIKRAEAQFLELWSEYKGLEISGKQPPITGERQLREGDFLEDFLHEDEDSSMPWILPSTLREFDEMQFFQEASDPWLYNVSDPVKFWITHQDRWPHVANMALDIFGIPPTEADNERLYSTCGDMVTRKRHGLKANTIGAIQSLRQWDQEGIIDWH